MQVYALFLQKKEELQSFFFPLYMLKQRQTDTGNMGDEKHKGKVSLMEDTQEKVLYETEASFGPDDKADYPRAGNSIYSAILSRNETVKDAKRLKTFLELRDKYLKKKVVFEDPLFPANDSSLFYSQPPPMKFEWKRPSVSARLLSSYPLGEVALNRKVALTCLQKLFSKISMYLITSSRTCGWGGVSS